MPNINSFFPDNKNKGGQMSSLEKEEGIHPPLILLHYSASSTAIED